MQNITIPLSVILVSNVTYGQPWPEILNGKILETKISQALNYVLTSLGK